MFKLIVKHQPTAGSEALDAIKSFWTDAGCLNASVIALIQIRIPILDFNVLGCKGLQEQLLATTRPLLGLSATHSACEIRLRVTFRTANVLVTAELEIEELKKTWTMLLGQIAREARYCVKQRLIRADAVRRLLDGLSERSE